jgi:hypothetical protein
MCHVPGHFRKPTKEQCAQFLQESQRIANQFCAEEPYRSRWGIHYGFMTRAARPEAHEWFERRFAEGRLLGLIEATFDEYGCQVFGTAWWGKRPQSPRYGGHDWAKCPYRNGNSYRRRDDHEPKPEEPTNEQCWREEQQHHRDKGKGRGWRRKPDSIAWYKTRSARDHRRWVRGRLEQGDFDAFGQYEYDQFVNPWDYD